MGDDDLVSENAARGVDLVDREVDAVRPVACRPSRRRRKTPRRRRVRYPGERRKGEDGRQQGDARRKTFFICSSLSSLSAFPALSGRVRRAVSFGHHRIEGRAHHLYRRARAGEEFECVRGLMDGEIAPGHDPAPAALPLTSNGVQSGE